MIREALENIETTKELDLQESKSIELLEKEDYKAFFNKKLKKYGVKSANNLPKKEKKKFYSEVDTEWDAGENETD